MGVPRRRLRPSADRILAAAEALFAARGYAAVSLRQLIAASGMSTTAFYARFDSKAAVLDTLTAGLFADLHAEAAETLRHVSGLDEGIERGVELLCDKLTARRALVRLIISEAGAHGPSASARRRSY